jgi:hypothetical protein
MNSNKPKQKFRYVNDPSVDRPGYWAGYDNKKAVIEDESFLIAPRINSRDKTQLKLENEFSPNNFEVVYKNCLKKDVKDEKHIIYYANRDIGAGRGFGNLKVSNDIRLGNQGRNDNEKPESRENMEQKQTENRWYYLDKNVQDPQNLIMPFPRGGESTRKQNAVQVDTMRPSYKEQIKTELERVIKFDYEY